MATDVLYSSCFLIPSTGSPMMLIKNKLSNEILDSFTLASNFVNTSICKEYLNVPKVNDIAFLKPSSPDYLLS